MDATFSDTDRARIRDAIATAEAKTAGEIFVVVARQSDEYHFIPLLWAMLLALAVPLPLIFLTLLPVTDIYLIQLAVFLAAAIMLSVPEIRPLTVPKQVRNGRAHLKAVEQFMAHGLHTTEARTGVLIFVSLAERYAEIVADAGIAAKVDQAVWNETMNALLAEIRAGRLADGLVGAIEKTGAVLALHFLRRPGDLNELPDDLVVL
jgi:putative membrane protein